MAEIIKKKAKKKSNIRASEVKNVVTPKKKTSEKKDTHTRGSEKTEQPSQPGAGGVGSGVKNGMKNMSLGSIKAVRKTMARMMKLYNKGLIDAEMFRQLTYSITVLLQCFKSEINQDLEERVEKLEARFNDVN